jgi:GAF domain-containing protein
LSQAIQNARLFEGQQQNLLQNRRLFLESETNLREIERLNRQLTGQSWQEYIVERDPAMFGVQITGEDVSPGAAEWTPAMRQAAERRRIVSQQRGDEQTLAVPINIRGEAIGAIEVRLSGQQNQTEVRNIVQAVAERMAVNLENIRLFEQARIAAEREQQINRITARLQGLTSIEDVLSTALDTLGQALGAERGSIRLAAREVVPVEESLPPAPDPAVRPLSDQRKTSEASVPPQNNDTGSQA